MATPPNNDIRNTHRDISDDEDHCSDYQNTASFSEFQEKVTSMYTSIIELVSTSEFRNNIKQEVGDIQDVDIEYLAKRGRDIKKTECPIVIAGETSSGKSTIINLLIGEKILPTNVTACTTKLCRIKSSETLSISKRNVTDEIIETDVFRSIDEMSQSLKEFASTKTLKYPYLDIEMPVSMIEGNMILVDTPGIGDEDQEDISSMMMNYLPNALAVVFVVNVANAGGIQTDRLGEIISHVRDSMNENMFCFSPEDTIFLLNKWDAIEDDDGKEEFFELTKAKLHDLWHEIDGGHILKLSASKACKQEDYAAMFDEFERILKNIIAKNENKRMRVHLDFLKSYLGACQKIASVQLRKAEQEQDEISQKIDHVHDELSELKTLVQGAKQDLPRLIEDFLDIASGRFYEYIHTDEFKDAIFKDSEEWTRFGIEKELETRIDKASVDWQKQHIETILLETVMGKVGKKFSEICGSLDFLKTELQTLGKGYDFKRMVSVIATSGVMGGLLRGFVVNPPIAAGVTVACLLSGIVWKGVFSSFEGTRKKAFEGKLATLPKEEIKKAFRQKYANVSEETIKTSVREFEMKISEIKQTLDVMKDEICLNNKNTSKLRSINSTISNLNADLTQIEGLEVK